jgi:hypothetical protein
MKESKFKIVCENNSSYQFNVLSCNPQDPVLFKYKKKKAKKDWHNELNEYIGGPSKGPSKFVISTKREMDVDTKIDENPIKIEVMSITSDQGEPTGNSAVLYGYYTVERINFYMNREQSTANLNFTVLINQDDSVIILK